jgi:hypothetical protein
MNQITSIITILLILGCSNKDPKISSGMQTTNDININIVPKLKAEILENGNVESYENLSTNYLDHQIPEELILYSLIMANDYNDVQAHFDVYSNIYSLYKGRKDKINSNMAQMALEYLIRAAKLGHHQAVEEVKEYGINEKSNPIEVMKRILAE